MSTTFALPYPPTVNRYWRHPSTGKLAGRHLISEEGRRYRLDVQRAIIAQRVRAVAGRLAVHIVAHMPDRRTRDLDNITKAVLDGLTHAHIWVDDSVIDDLRITRGGSLVNGGQLQVTVSVIGEASSQPSLLMQISDLEERPF